MAQDRFAKRRRKLSTAMRKAGLESLLVSHEPNVRYLTNFTGDSSLLLLGRGVELMISDSRFETQLKQECPDLETIIRTSRTTLTDCLTETLAQRKIKRVGIEGSSMTVSEFRKLSEKLPDVEFVPVEGLVEELREIKDQHEIAAIRRAIDQAQVAFQGVQAMFTPEMTEREVAHELEHLMRRRGAVKAAFDPIVGVGPQSALPHYRPAHARLSDSPFVLIDWGAVESEGYHSDLTRVLCTSKIPPKLDKLYRVVLQAHDSAIRELRPGVAGKVVDAVARKVIADAGFEKFFGHGLGHGIGLEIHEGPRLSPLAERILQPGMVITIEPGIYLPGVGGVRLEDDVLITEDGYEVLTSTPLSMQ